MPICSKVRAIKPPVISHAAQRSLDVKKGAASRRNRSRNHCESAPPSWSGGDGRSERPSVIARRPDRADQERSSRQRRIAGRARTTSPFAWPLPRPATAANRPAQNPSPARHRRPIEPADAQFRSSRKTLLVRAEPHEINTGGRRLLPGLTFLVGALGLGCRVGALQIWVRRRPGPILQPLIPRHDGSRPSPGPTANSG